MLGKSDVVFIVDRSRSPQLMIEALPQTAPPVLSTATTSDATNSLRADGGSTRGGSPADLLFERALSTFKIPIDAHPRPCAGGVESRFHRWIGQFERYLSHRTATSSTSRVCHRHSAEPFALAFQ